MVLTDSLTVLSPSLPVQFRFPFSNRSAFFYRFPRSNHSIGVSLVSCSSPKSIPFTEQEILKFVAETNVNSLPCVRTYENDLARLSLVGAVNLDQALTAAAADGGRAASEHVDAGVPTMVVETVFPGSVDKHSTVSTRLFLPAWKVKEKANKLRKTISDDILSMESSRNILAMTFRQVVLQKLWDFELVLFKPGSERNINDLENPREVGPSFILRSSDERFISVLAEVVCLAALQSTERNFLDELWVRTSTNFFQWFRKNERVASKDSSVVLDIYFEEDIAENAKGMFESWNPKNEFTKHIKVRQKDIWWTPSTCSKLENIGGPKFRAWASEYMPAYRLKVDVGSFKDVRLEGWIESPKNKWDAFLTHSQMTDLADILDMFYEDVFSLPNKQLQCGALQSHTSLSNKKRNSSLLKFLSATLASGMFLIAFSAFNQFCFPYLQKGLKYPGGHRSLPPSEIEPMINRYSENEQLENFCISVVQKIKDALGWPGDIETEASIGAWIGEIPIYLKMCCETNSSGEEKSMSAELEDKDAELKSSLQDVAIYQVVMSGEGKIVGFQPTNRVGVNQWASNPLAKELYGGRKLAPGFLEPGLRIRLPKEVVVMELLMSTNSETCFALARPLR